MIINKYIFFFTKKEYNSYLNNYQFSRFFLSFGIN